MTFTEALTKMEDGRRVRRPHWPPDLRMEFDHFNALILTSAPEAQYWRADLVHLRANDWEVI